MRSPRSLGSVLSGLILLACGLVASCGGDSNESLQLATTNNPTSSSSSWIGAWGAAPYGPFPLGPVSGIAPIDPLALTAVSLANAEQATDQSFRMIIKPTIGGDTVRLRLSNLVGDQPVSFTSVQIALRAAGPAIVPGTEKPLLFGGEPDVVVQPGDEAISDPIDFSYAFGDELSVSFHVQGESGPMTWHAVSFGLNYVGIPGSDVTGDPSGLSFVGQPTVGWFFISGLDVLKPDSPGTIVAIGDSITDGAYIIPETNTRWPDFLAQRLSAADIEMGVLNEGINSNTVTDVSTNPASGEPAVLRFDRDVLSRPNVKSVIIFEGTNDIGAGADAVSIYAGLQTLIRKSRQAGLCVLLATIPPRNDTVMGYDRDQGEPVRLALNDLIRSNTDVNAIVDFDAALASPAMPDMPNPALYFPDLLHPQTLGFYVMAEAIPLEALVPPPVGNCR